MELFENFTSDLLTVELVALVGRPIGSPSIAERVPRAVVLCLDQISSEANKMENEPNKLGA